MDEDTGESTCEEASRSDCDPNNLTEAYKIIQDSWKNILKALNIAYGLNYMGDENFEGTPERNARALLERCVGINSEKYCEEMLERTFPSTYKGMIIVDPVTVNGLCPHHFEDVYYLVRVGYIPRDRCVGLSKISRVIKLLGSQPILQEDFTKNICDVISKSLNAEGICVVTHARHNCMVARGIKQNGALVTMSEVRGSFLSNPSVKEEFYQLCSLNPKSLREF